MGQTDCTHELGLKVGEALCSLKPDRAAIREGGETFPGIKGFAMSRPTPLPIESAKLKELALAVMKAARFPQLATIDGDQPRVRPVSPVRTDEFTIYVANLRSYHKTVEIEANPNVELCYLNDQHDQVRITGRAVRLTDAAMLQQIWTENPLLRQYLGTIDNPELIVYRVDPVRVRYMKEWALEYYEVPLG